MLPSFEFDDQSEQAKSRDTDPQQMIMIQNIIDNRTRSYRWQRVNAIVEPTWHDNSCANADQAPVREDDDAVVYDAQESIKLADAITWANGFACAVTLYLYDEGDGTP